MMPASGNGGIASKVKGALQNMAEVSRAAASRDRTTKSVKWIMLGNERMSHPV